MRPTLLHLAVGLSATLLAGCPSKSDDLPKPVKKLADKLPAPVKEVVATLDERGGVALAEDPHGDGADAVTYLDQNWGPVKTLWYYFADQGSTLIEYATLVNLEQPGSTEKFVAPANMARFRLLPQRKTPGNPDALPVGITKHDVKGGEPMAGMTCAACHTSQIIYNRTAVRIDGAPSLLDLYGFLDALNAAMAATLADPAKLERFTKAAAGKRSPDAVKASLEKDHAWLTRYTKAAQTKVTPGHGRIDAIGLIMNQVISMTSGWENALEPNAPTSFPLLWDAPRHDWVQWTGFSSNAEAGSLGRNAGEVVGVFGDVDVVKYTDAEAAKAGYVSSIEGGELVLMEEALRALTSPVWPKDVLPAIDAAKAKAGEAIYAKDCAGCHALIDRDNKKRHVTAMMYGIDKVGTDPQSAINFNTARAPSGKLEGAIRFDEKGVYAAEEPVTTLLSDLVRGSLKQMKPAALAAVANAKMHGQAEQTERQGDYTPASEANPRAHLMTYKARPLNGIWAASPYLHNGSVPTLYDLLLPAAQRPKTFKVGRWAYDPKKVGYVYDSGPSTVDTSIPGNLNTGHEYGTALSDGDRWALVEYLKTL